MNKIVITAALMLTMVGCKSQQSDPEPVAPAAKAKSEPAKVAETPKPAEPAAEPMKTAAEDTTAKKEGVAPTGETPAKEAAAKKDLPEIEVAALASLISEKKPVTVFDANRPETRKKEGVIPGAKLLTSAKEYPVSELPKDKAEKLVFYCYNEMCPASHSAAEKAIISGHTDVSILTAGIVGWKKAGNKTQTVQ